VKKSFKWGLIILAVIIILIQLYRPERFTTEEITANHITKKLNIPANVESILQRSCYDCHSNHTKWPWYSNIAPVSWLVTADVVGGRKKMNFSNWGKLSLSKQSIKLENICEEITEGEMPLPQYLLIHKEAELRKEDKDILCSWAKGELKKLESEGDTEKENEK
jgi:hypothetical protein